MNSSIGIIDYGMGNLGSVTNAFRFLGEPAEVVAAPEAMASCSAIVLPGVGAFGDCMAHLRRHGFEAPLVEWVRSGRPFFGMCLGLQALFESSEEDPGVPGLGLLPGVVRKFPAEGGLKVPQIGWNRVRPVVAGHPLFEGIPDDTHFYFVHSFYAEPADASCVLARSEYGLRYACAVQMGPRACAVQFHPEKSQRLGLAMLANFARWARQPETPS